MHHNPISASGFNRKMMTAMKEWLKVFLAFLSIGVGIWFVSPTQQLTYYFPEWAPYVFGIVLIAGGFTFFWTRSKFYKG
jgi:hypothetical protein